MSQHIVGIRVRFFEAPYILYFIFTCKL